MYMYCDSVAGGLLFAWQLGWKLGLRCVYWVAGNGRDCEAALSYLPEGPDISRFPNQGSKIHIYFGFWDTTASTMMWAMWICNGLHAYLFLDRNLRKEVLRKRSTQAQTWHSFA